MSDFANALRTGRQPQQKTTDAEFAAGSILAILVVAQLMFVAQNREIFRAAEQFAPFGIFAP